MSVKSLRCATGYIEIVERGRQGSKGDDGVIAGGLTGEVLTKLSDADNDYDWEPVPEDETTQGNIPYKDSGVLKDSGLYVNGNGELQTNRKIISEVGFETTSNSIELGEGACLKASGPQIIAESKVTGVRYELPYQSIDKTGSGDTFVIKAGAESKSIIQPIFDTPLISPLSVPIVATNDEIINALYFQTDGDVYNLRFELISVATGKPILTYPNKYHFEREEGSDIIGAGEHKVDLFYFDHNAPIRLLNGESFNLNAFWDASPGNILGEVSGGVPYFAIDLQVFEFKNLALIEDLQNLGGFLGYFSNEASLRSAHPTGNDGDSAVVLSTNSIWFWDINAGPADWVDTTVAPGGDMAQAIYDPTGVGGDAFSMNNMSEGALTKVFTSAERIKLQGIETGAEVNRSSAELKIDYESNADTNAFTDTEKTKLSGIEDGAEVNRTNSQLKIDYESNLDTNAFDDAYKTAVDNNTAKISFPGWDANPANIVMQEPTGFPLNEITGEVDLTSSVLIFNNGTRTFSISPSSVDFSVYQSGVKYTFNTTQSIQIPDVEGLHYFYFDNGVLNTTNTLDLALIYSKVFIAIVYWDFTNKEAILFGEERHSLKMDGHTHVRLHEGSGTIYLDGLALEGFNINDGSADIDAQFGAEAGNIKDEDILISRDAVSSITGLPIFYKLGSGGEWRRSFNAGFSVLTTGTGRLAWNEFTGSAWQQTEVTDGSYVLAHIFASNDLNYPFYSIMGQSEYSTLEEARDGSYSEITSLVAGEIPFVEFVAVGTVIFQTNDTYANAVKAKVVLSYDNVEYADWRNSDISARNTPPPTFHNSALGLQGGIDGEHYHLTEAQFNNLVFGTEFQIEEDNSLSSTASTTYVPKLTLTTPSLPAGTYKVSWSASVGHTANQTTNVRCILDGIDTLSEVGVAIAAGGTSTLQGSFTTRVLTSGVHNIAIEYSRIAGGGNATIEQARIEIHRVA